MYGIDVSKWQGSIDWAKVRSAGKEFAILKVTNKNNTVESTFETNYAGCIKNGIPVGVYRYVYAKDVASAQEEAKAIVKALKGKTIKCGVWLDMEDSTIRNVGKNALTNIINAQSEIIRAAGYSVGIYCNANWYKNVLDSKVLEKSFPFWIARYPSADNGTVKESLSPKAYAKCWQYSSKGKVAGITGNVDLNVSFVDLVELMSRNATVPEIAKPTLRKGSKGTQVKNLQNDLNYVMRSGLSVDGDFGSKTESAVKAYQKQYGLVVDGIYGAKSYAKMKEVLK